MLTLNSSLAMRKDESHFKYRSGLDATTEELTGIANFRSKHMLQRSAYHDLIRRVAHQDLLLLVAERIDESILVLGHLMRWSLPQLVSFSHKVGVYIRVDEKVYRALDELQPFDLGLWRLANAALTKYIADNYDREDFARKLTELADINEKAHTRCIKDPTSSHECSMMLDNNAIVRAKWKERKEYNYFF